MRIETELDISTFNDKLAQFWHMAAEKVKLLKAEYDSSLGSPVFTAEGKYTTRGWTEWTQGFQYGIPLLVFDAIGDTEMLEIGRNSTFANMSHHISHCDVLSSFVT